MENQKIIIEACVETLQQAVEAQKKGADQIEFCDRLDLGGTSHTQEMIETVLSQMNIPVKCMIRPRGGNFIYTQKEFDQILETLSLYKSIGVTEVVTGMLNENKEVHLAQLKTFLVHAQGLKVTFHKAIDETPDIFEATRQLVELEGVHSILTSGGKITAWEGKEILKNLNARFGDQIVIIAAGSITRENLSNHVAYIGARTFHGRRIIEQ